MTPGEVRNVDCHCPACTTPMTVQVQQCYNNEIDIIVRDKDGKIVEPKLNKKLWQIIFGK